MRILAALVLLAGMIVPVRPADAAARPGRAGFCPDANGVTVVIDFQDLGGTTIVRCAPGAQATGLDALQNAGIQVTGTTRWGLGFICRIEGKPGPDTEPCIDTPPASAYWSYWNAPNGGSWHYSEWGVKNRTPPAGSFEGWSFSHNRTASTNPPPRVAPVRAAPASSDGSTGSGGSSGSTGSGGSSGSGGSTGSGGGAGQTGTGADGGGTPATPFASASPSASASTSMSAAPMPGPTNMPTEAPGWTGGDDLKDPAAATKHDGGGAFGWTLLGVGILLTLVVCGGYRMRLRRDRS